MSNKKTIFLAMIFFGLFGMAKASYAADFYVAQAAAGSGNGTSCANAYVYTWFNNSGNWANPKISGKIGPGDMVHICGTITGSAGGNALTFQGSGSSGSPITLKFETDAVLTAPYWSSTTSGAIYCSGQSYITIDGGTNGTIENSADGTALQYQHDSAAIVTSCPNSEIKNVNIQNMYIRTEDTEDIADTIGISTAGASNTRIDNNTLSHTRIGIAASYSNGTTNVEVDHNTETYVEHGISVGNLDQFAADYANNYKIHDNDIGGGAYLWDSPSNAWHHDGIHCWNQSSPYSQISNLWIYNNYIHGKWGNDQAYYNSTGGTHITAPIFLEHLTASVFNNVIDFDTSNALSVPDDTWVSAGGGVNIPATADPPRLYNNTMRVYAGYCWLADTPNGTSVHSYVANNLCIIANSTGTGGIVATDMVNDSGSSVDYDVYSFAGESNCFSVGSNVNSLSAFQGYGYDIHGFSTSSPDLNTILAPLSGSPLIAAGANLTSTGITALDSDKSGAARPATGAWDIGAYQYQSGSGTIVPNSPTGLSVE